MGDFLRQDAGSTAEEIDAYTAAIQAERAEYGAFTVLLWQLHPGRAPECRAITNVEDTMPPFGASSFCSIPWEQAALVDRPACFERFCFLRFFPPLLKDNGAARVPPGVHVLTNGPLNIDWFKASHGRQQFEQVLAQKDASREDKIQGFLRLLKDQTLYVDDGGQRLCRHKSRSALISSLCRSDFPFSPPEGSRGPPMKELSSINVYQ